MKAQGRNQKRRESRGGYRTKNGRREIRVQPSPHWDADKVTVFFWFLLEAGTIIDFDTSRKVIDNWMSLANFTTPFVLANPPFNLVEPQDMTAQDYLTSYPLDFEDVSP